MVFGTTTFKYGELELIWFDMPGDIKPEYSKELVDLYSNDKHVTPNTPPALILLSSDDFLVPVANSLRYYEALVANKVSASMHIYPSGGHGWGIRDNFKYHNEMLNDLSAWLETIK